MQAAPTRRSFVVPWHPVNLVLLRPSEVDDNGCALVSDRRAQHLRTVLGVNRGRQLRVGITDGRLGAAEVLEDCPTGILMRLELTGRAPPLPPVRLVVAIPRPKVLSRVLQSVAALGVEHIDLVNAWRVQASYFQSPKLAPDSIVTDLWLGAEQAGDPRLPTVEVHRLFVPFVEERLSLPASGQLRLLAQPGAEVPLESAALGKQYRTAIVAVGPEGGWIEAEQRSLCEVGFTPVRVSDRVLRVETAVASVLSQLELVRRLERQSKSRNAPRKGEPPTG
jgi:16S rRNA (uracil1498-N3)-methyltransferase